MVAFSASTLFRILRPSICKLNLANGVGVLSYGKSVSTMAYQLTDVVKSLNAFAPLPLAESWDNVGLLVEPPTPQQIKRVLLTNDLTVDVLEEALEFGANLIVSYHPPIFAPLKSITGKSWKEHIVGTLLENKIALYSPHTAWDVVEGGVNDWLTDAFEKQEATVKPIHQHYTAASFSHTISGNFCDSDSAQMCLRTITDTLKLTSCIIFQSDTSFILEVNCSTSDTPQLIQLMNNASDIKVTKNEQVPLGHFGSGRKFTLVRPMSLQDVVDAVKNHLKLKDVSLAIARGKCPLSLVSTIALCAGSGSSVLKGVNADVYLTGEMLHHDVLDAVHKGTHVILTRHSNSERGFLNVVAERIFMKDFPGIEIIVSEQDKDPLITA